MNPHWYIFHTWNTLTSSFVPLSEAVLEIFFCVFDWALVGACISWINSGIYRVWSFGFGEEPEGPGYHIHRPGSARTRREVFPGLPFRRVPQAAAFAVFFNIPWKGTHERRSLELLPKVSRKMRLFKIRRKKGYFIQCKQIP